MFFNPDEVSDEYDLLPAGRYRFLVEAAAVKTNKKGAGNHISAKLQVIEGDKKGRVHFANFNMNHENKQAEQIGRGQFKRFTVALFGQPLALVDAEDVVKVVNKTVLGDVIHRVGGDGVTRAEVKAFYPDGPQAASKPAAQAKKASAPKTAPRGEVLDDLDPEVPF